MRLNKLYFDNALKELADRRAENSELEDRRKAEIAEKLPEYQTLQAALADTVSDVMNSIIGKPESGDVSPAFEKNLEIQRQMKELLENNGYPADYLDPIHTCKKCEDTGSVGNEWCECLCKITNKMAAEELNKNAPLDRSTFERFDITRYTDKTDKDNPVSPRDIMQKNLEYCKKFAENFGGSGAGIFMLGGTGLGKTHLSLSIANKLLENGFCVVYGSVPELIRKIQNEQFNRADGDTMSLAESCDLLILDDLGAENSTDWCVSMLYEIINTRQNRRLPMIINTNLDLDDLKVKYHDRLSSRMFSMKIMLFSGNDNRVEFSESFGGAI